MSIANLFVPNDLNLFCGTVTALSGAQPVTLTNAYYGLTTNASLANNSGTSLLFDTPIIVNPRITFSSGIYTINTPGMYTFDAMVNFFTASAGLGVRSIYFLKNSQVQTQRRSEVSVAADATAAVPIILSSSYTDIFIAGDTVVFQVFQTQTASISLLGSAGDSLNFCQMSISAITST
jgi:hypothetical protein